MMIFAADTLIAIGLSTISLGTIQEADGVQEHLFCLRNAGTVAVRLTEGYSSCHCTTVVFDKNATILPGDSTHVTLRFNPQGKGGDFYESGTLRYEVEGKASGERKAITVAMEGTCITSEETLLRQFPVRINDSIRLSTDRFDLGFMNVGESKERNVVVLFRSEGDRQECIPITFTVDEQTPKGLQHIPYLIGYLAPEEKSILAPRSSLPTPRENVTPIYVTLDVFIR
jgi:hypothetical protein